MTTQTSTAEAQAALGDIRIRKRVVKNWAGTYSCRPGSVYKPKTEAQVIAIVELAKSQKQTVRAVGARHSPSDVFCVPDGGVLVDMQDLKRVLKVDKETKTVEAEAGILLGMC